MQITRLLIDNVRAIAHLEIDLATSSGDPRRRVVLLGANGAGKTTILDALAHVFQTLSPAYPELGARGLQPSDVRNAKISNLQGSDSSPIGSIVLEGVLSEREFTRHRSGFYGDISLPKRGRISVGVGDPLSAFDTSMSFSSDPRADGLQETILEPPDLFLNTARSAIDNYPPPCVLLPSDRGMLTHFEDIMLREVTERDPRRDCLAATRERFVPLSARLALAFNGGDRNDRGGRVARMWKVLAKYFPELPRPVSVDGLELWFETSGRSLVPLSALSDGERALLLIFGEIALRPPEDGMVLIDEIEQHLHPRWQRTILEALAALVPTAQFVVTTQSPYLAAAAPDDVIEIGDWKRYGK